ncbi:MAG: hypothetical protein AAF655_26390 [Bacteroidota bacterium]
MKSPLLTLLTICLISLAGLMGCQGDPYSQAKKQKEALKDSVRISDSLHAIRLGDTVREIKIMVREELRPPDSTQNLEAN